LLNKLCGCHVSSFVEKQLCLFQKNCFNKNGCNNKRIATFVPGLHYSQGLKNSTDGVLQYLKQFIFECTDLYTAINSMFLYSLGSSNLISEKHTYLFLNFSAGKVSGDQISS
jgi:hypothetical protein